MKHTQNEPETPLENLQNLANQLYCIGNMQKAINIDENIVNANRFVNDALVNGRYDEMDDVVRELEAAKWQAALHHCESLFAIVMAEYFVWEIIADTTYAELVHELPQELSSVGTIPCPKCSFPMSFEHEINQGHCDVCAIGGAK